MMTILTIYLIITYLIGLGYAVPVRYDASFIAALIVFIVFPILIWIILGSILYGESKNN